jgi:hypothetical protein
MREGREVMFKDNPNGQTQYEQPKKKIRDCVNCDPEWCTGARMIKRMREEANYWRAEYLRVSDANAKIAREERERIANWYDRIGRFMSGDVAAAIRSLT